MANIYGYTALQTIQSASELSNDSDLNREQTVLQTF